MRKRPRVAAVPRAGYRAKDTKLGREVAINFRLKQVSDVHFGFVRAATGETLTMPTL